jgi:ATP-dependent Clp protease ATP-binding subunit ClpC
VLRAIAQTYRPEFQNRLDKVIVFAPLTRDRMRAILQKELAAVRERRGLKDRSWAVEWESSALEFLLERGFSPEMGARPLKRAIDQYLVAPLAAIIVEKRFPEGDQFLFVRSDGEGIQVEFVDPDADASDKLSAAAVAEPVPHSALASAILAPQGTPGEFQMLEAECEAVQRRFGAADWSDLKEELTAEMSSAVFWNRPDRFGVLARFALMDRVKSAAETAHALRDRALRYSQSPRRYSAELNGRLALQLHLIREGIRDAFDDAPVEVALTIEPVFDGADDRTATLRWCKDLTAMYRAWAEKRRMQIRDLPSANGPRAADPILLVSGFGAHRVLGAEAGLHVFEPSEGAISRVAARVCVEAGPPRPAFRRRRAQRDRRHADDGTTLEQRRATLPRTAAAGARRCRAMAHRPPRPRARRRVRPVAGRCRLDVIRKSGSRFSAKHALGLDPRDHAQTKIQSGTTIRRKIIPPLNSDQL